MQSKSIKNSSELRKAFSILLSGTLIVSVLGFISTALIARSLGSDIFGIFAIMTSLTLIIDKLINFQTWQGLIHFGAKYLSNNNEIIDEIKFKKTVNSFFMLDIITSILGFLFSILIISYIYNYFSWPPEYWNYIIIYLFSLLFKFSSFSLGIYRLFNKHYLQMKISTLVTIIRLVLILFLYYYESTLGFYLIAWALTEVILNITLTVNAFKIIKSKYIKKNQFSVGINKKMELFRFSFWTNVAGIVDLPAKELDTLIVGFLAGDKEAGFYKLAKQCMSMIGRLASPLYQAIYPIQVKIITDNKKRDALKLTKSVSLKITLFSFIFIAISYFIIDDLIITFLGTSYKDLIFIAFVAICIKSIDIIFTAYHALFIAYGFVKQNVILLSITNLALIIGFFILIPIGGSELAIYCIGFQAIITFLLKYIYIKRATRNEV